MSLAVGRRRIFAITWITYAGFYFCRKNLGIVLPLLHGAAGLKSLELANVVFGYSVFYAFGQFGAGFLSDRIGPKRVVGAGLILVVLSNLLMGMGQSLVWLLLFACLNGVGQSTGWSGLVKMMASWFDSANRGVVMAWWGTNYVLGGFLATLFATWSVGQAYILPQLAWRRGFLFPALVLLAVVAIFLVGVRDTPTVSSGEIETAFEKQQERSTWTDLLLLLRKRSLWMISISYFFLELCRYALMFWLPMYMMERLKYNVQTAGYASSLYELIGIVGALAAGYISDRFMQSRRAPVSVAMLFGLAVVLLLHPWLANHGLIGTAIAISLAGMLSYGPDTLLSGAGAQDIGETRSAATAAGLVDGIGHLGALFSPYVVVFVSERYGWDYLFFAFAGGAFLAGLVLIPIWKLTPVDHRNIASEQQALQGL
jgi:OPA family sugar phosphate sensor protein UhpC-like MFS transporter